MSTKSNEIESPPDAPAENTGQATAAPLSPEIEKIVAAAVAQALAAQAAAPQTAPPQTESEEKPVAKATEPSQPANSAPVTTPAPQNPPPPPSGTPGKWNMKSAVKSLLKRYTKFTGRASRSEYWYFVLFNFIVVTSISVLMSISCALGAWCGLGIIIPSIIFNLILTVYNLFILVPGVALCVRRLQDSGLNWKLLLLALIPVVGIFILVYLMVRPSGPANQYGEGPDYIASDDETMPPFVATVVSKAVQAYTVLRKKSKLVAGCAAGVVALIAIIMVLVNIIFARPNPLEQLQDEGKLVEEAADANNMYEGMFFKQYQAYLDGDMELSQAPFIANLLAVAESKKFDVPVEVIKAMVELGAELKGKSTVTPFGDTVWNLAIEHNQLHLLDYLASAGAEKKDWSDMSACPHVVTAVREDNEELLRALARNGMNLDVQKDATNATALMEAISAGKINMLNLLIELGANVNATRSDYGNGKSTVLDEALSCGRPNDTEMVQILVKAGAKGSPASMAHKLSTAIDEKNIDVIKLLLSAGAALDFRNEITGDLPIHAAIVPGNEEIVKLLVEAGSPLNELDNSPVKSTPLMKAASIGSVEMVEILQKAGADTNIATTNLMGKQVTAIQMARAKGNPVILAILNGKDKNSVPADAISLQEANELLEKYDIIETSFVRIDNVILKEMEYKQADDLESAMCMAMFGAPPPCYYRKQASNFKKHLNLYIDGVEEINDFPYLNTIYNLAHWLSVYRDAAHKKILPKITKAFLCMGIDINARHNDVTALELAAGYGDVETVRFLLENGADPALKNAKGKNLYMQIKKDSAVGKLLYEIAPPSAELLQEMETATTTPAPQNQGNQQASQQQSAAQPSQNQTPPAADEIQNQEEQLDKLIAELESTEYGTATLKLYKTRLLNILPRIKNGESVNTVLENANGTTAIHNAAGLGHYDIVKWLIDNGADCTVRTAKGASLEDCIGDDPGNKIRNLIRSSSNKSAAATEDRSSLDPLIQRMRDLRCRQSDSALYQKRLLTLLPMIRNGADVNLTLPETKGNTALHYSCAIGSLSITKWLLAHGANPNAVTDKGKTPMQCVGSDNRKAIIKELKAYGAQK